MTGFKSKRDMAEDKLLPQKDFDDDLTIAYQSGYYDGKKAAAQEPVAWLHVQGNYEEPSFRQLADDEVERGWKQYPLYNTPPQRPWVGLTDDERLIALKFIDPKTARLPEGFKQFSESIEQLLKERNK